MDATLENILMCDKSGLRCPRAWTPCGNSTQSIIRIGDDIFALRDGESTAARWVWLPSQDQLQEMVKKETETSRGLVDRFRNWCYSTKELYSFSMEQLWLAAVMDWKFCKQWNGKDWNYHESN